MPPQEHQRRQFSRNDFFAAGAGNVLMEGEPGIAGNWRPSEAAEKTVPAENREKERSK